MLLLVTAVILRILINPLANLFQKQLTLRGHPALLVNATTYALLTATVVPLLFLAGKLPLASLPAAFWIYAILGGILGATGNAFLVKAMEQGELSVLGPINAYKSVVGMLVGIFLLQEYPNFYGIAGVVLIIAGSYFVLDNKNEPFHWSHLKRPAIKFRLWAMVLTAIEAVVGKKVIEYSNVDITVASWCFWGTVFSLLLLPLYKVELRSKPLTTADVGLVLALAVFIGGMQYCTSYVFAHMDVGYALSFFQLSAVISIFLGHAIYKESDIRRKLIGTGIMIVGSVLIFLLG